MLVLSMLVLSMLVLSNSHAVLFYIIYPIIKTKTKNKNKNKKQKRIIKTKNKNKKKGNRFLVDSPFAIDLFC